MILKVQERLPGLVSSNHSNDILKTTGDKTLGEDKPELQKEGIEEKYNAKNKPFNSFIQAQCISDTINPDAITLGAEKSWNLIQA